MTPAEEFMASANGIMYQMAFAYAGELDDRVKAVLAKFAADTHAGWDMVAPIATTEDIAEVVEDVLRRICSRRREIEGGGHGRA